MAYRDLDWYYRGGGTGLPFQGVCQGNGASPAIWLATSIILMDMVQSNSHRVTFCSPISQRPTDLLGLLYVDDCNLFAINTNNKHPCPTIAHLQRNIDLWQGGLAVTGGSLSAKKSSWCLLVMCPQGHHWAFHTTTSFLATLMSRGANQQPQLICRINPHEGIMVVGVIQSLLGTQKLALMALQAKANSWEQALHSMEGLHTLPAGLDGALRVIWPSLCYPLAVTSFSESQALSITSRLYHTLLPCLGMNRHYPLDLCHAPAKYQGLGLLQPFWEQGVSAMKLFLEFMNTS